MSEVLCQSRLRCGTINVPDFDYMQEKGTITFNEMRRIKFVKIEQVVIKKGRSKWEIIIDVLEVIRVEENAKKTRIMYKANLDWRTFQKYYNFLIEEGLMVECNPENDCYMLTEIGKKLLQKLMEVDEVLVKGDRIL
jgi:predicted transcriptional regulator